MNSNSPVEIHEFSTGIKFDRLPNGGWVSRGFTGEYMNCTIDPVPPAVERSISNREFRIAEGTASREPAVVARVVGEGEDSWSVVAIVSLGEDEVGRGGSFYRYFLAQGKDKIPHILEWLEQERDSHNRNSSQIPIFNPLEAIDKPHYIYVKPLNLSVAQDSAFLNDNIPVVLYNKTSNQIAAIRYIHALTLKKLDLEEKKQNYVPIAWAFNVEAVEQINRFTIIRAASENAVELLKRAKASAAKALPLALFDEQAVKSAVKGITNSSSNALKTEYINALAEAIANTAITESHWHRIFDGQGANNALKQRIYTPQMIKLLILRALAIPSTLPEYYAWRAEAANSKNNNVEAIAQEFEWEFGKKTKGIGAIKKNIVEGYGAAVSEFLDESLSIEAMVDLLGHGQGLWKSNSQAFIKSVRHDLSEIERAFNNSQRINKTEKNFYKGITRQSPGIDRRSIEGIEFVLKGESWQATWQEISKYWGINPSTYQNQNYSKFAQLFEKIGENDLALVFYHISEGILAPNKFKQLANTNNSEKKVFGLTIKREDSLSERARKFLASAFKLLRSTLYLIFTYLAKNPSQGKSSLEKNMRRFITLILMGGTLVGGIAIGNANLIRFPFIAEKDKSDRPTASGNSDENEKQPGVKGQATPISASPTPSAKPKNSASPNNKDKDIEEKKKRLAHNIVSIYELIQDLENNGVFDSESKVLEKLKITSPGDVVQAIKSTLQEIKIMTQPPNKISREEIERKTYNDILSVSDIWTGKDIPKILQKIDDDNKTKGKALTSIKERTKDTDKTILGKIQAELKNQK